MLRLSFFLLAKNRKMSPRSSQDQAGASRGTGRHTARHTSYYFLTSDNRSQFTPLGRLVACKRPPARPSCPCPVPLPAMAYLRSPPHDQALRRGGSVGRGGVSSGRSRAHLAP
eukprot:COSAG01_NODE_763_length_13784_cov_13.112897_4_plen_113_part_00